MFTSAELIEALRRRLRRSIRPQPLPDNGPPGWQAWLAARETGKHAPGAAVEDAIAVFLQRPPSTARGGYLALSPWQVCASLLRGGSGPPPPEDRGARRLALALTGVFHVFWVLSLVWLMVARFTAAPSEQARSGEQVTQVEFIGAGTPQAGGDAAPAAAGDAPAVAASSPAPPAAAAGAAAQAAALPAPEEAASPVPEQPLQVTETAEPDPAFAVPPTRIGEVPVTIAGAPAPRPVQAEIPLVALPSPAPALRPLPQQTLAAPSLRERPAEVAVREIPAAAPEVRQQPIGPGATPAPVLRGDGPQVVERALPAPLPAVSMPQVAQGPVPASAAARTAALDVRERGIPVRAPAAVAGEAPAAAGTQNAPLAQAAGALPSPRRGDDWGDAARDRAGGRAGASGLFNPDGSPRLAAGSDRVGGGLPPGTITEDYEKIDRMGTWRRRPPNDYRASSFEQLWVPHESLLEEWVRKSIKTVLIPIPGTGKSIRCTVALLMLGGGCGISDPNLQDVEAEARQPPDVPFKRELQEDQDSLDGN